MNTNNQGVATETDNEGESMFLKDQERDTGRERHRKTPERELKYGENKSCE